MKAETKTIDNIQILALSERLDASCSNDLKEIVQGMIEGNQIKLLINLGKVSFIDSSGLGTLITCLKNISKAGGQLKITELCANVKSVFDMTRMDRVFEIFDTNEAALKSFKLQVN
jgi:anti-sigma B factor antagonist